MRHGARQLALAMRNLRRIQASTLVNLTTIPMRTIAIPDEIDALDLTITDKVALATLQARPTTSNGCLARQLGLSQSGVRALLRRLRKRGFATELNIEGSRRFRVSVVSGCQIVTQNGAAEKCQKMTPPPSAPATPEECAQFAIKKAQDILRFIHYDHQVNWSSFSASFYAGKLTEAIEHVARDVPEPARAELLAILEPKRNAFAAVAYASDHLPASRQKQVDAWLARATQEQLAQIYERIEAERLLGAGPKTALLLAVTNGDGKA